ncbi:hypothetical protein COLO4_26604 [Corchorus olitorius]|uniref:Uncharacterized protein n=1 Tax=Corchorus olitorius TaxID=93759 RepID=A0A1R3HVS9_9ROSI|nr:hypothetical protein COLO4_26604 [Corchorus olitorius]
MNSKNPPGDSHGSPLLDSGIIFHCNRLQSLEKTSNPSRTPDSDPPNPAVGPSYFLGRMSRG